MTEPQPALRPPPPRRRFAPRRPSTIGGWALLGLIAIVLIVAAALVGARVGLLTPQGRLLIEARTSGLKLGRLGRLKVEGLGGDIWRDFTIRRLTVADEKGVWLEADDLDVRWSYARLLGRRLQIDDLTARQVVVIRRPSLAPKGKKSAGLPVTFDIAAMKFRLETLPAFSVEHGTFDVAGKLRLERGVGGQSGEVHAASLSHPGDRLDAIFDIGRTRPLLITAKADEAQGGAVAGALGLSPDRRFSAFLTASGSRTSGKLDGRIVSGRTAPVEAHGLWTPASGTFAGRADLTASRLTAGYVHMFGPQALVAVATRKGEKGRDGVAIQVRAQNLTLMAQGLADLKTRTSKDGLKLAVAVADASRLVGGPRTSRVHAQGVLSGSPLAWKFAGLAAVDGAALDGFTLAHAAGPVTISGKGAEIGVKANLVGSGGHGGGLLAGVVGSSPRASVDLSKLADGRLLIRAAEAHGAGFDLKASGSRGLLGGLNFKGKLDLNSLATARAGAGGALALQWTAIQGSKGKPWLFQAAGRGDKFRTGLGELDRLLGPSPKFAVQAAYGGGEIKVAKASIDGAKVSLSGAGVVNPSGPIAMKVSWTADGPFQAGPVQVSGKASGDGAITGTVAAPQADFAAKFAAIDVPSLPLHDALLHLTLVKAEGGVAGGFALQADSAYGPARAKSSFRFSQDGVDLTGIDADAGGVRAAGALSLRGSEPSTADLQLDIRPGAVLTQGQIEGVVRISDGGAAAAVVDLRASNAVVRGSGLTIASARLTGSGPLGHMPFQVTGSGQSPQGPFAIDGSGLYQQAPGGAQTVSFDGGGKFRGVDVHTTEPAVFRLNGKDRSTRLRLLLGGGQASLDATEAAGGVTASGVVRGVDLKTINSDLTGKFDADISLNGKGPRLNGTMTARLAGARSVDGPADTALNGVIKAVLTDDHMTLDAQATGGGGLTSSLNVVLPTEASAAPLHLAIVRNRPIQGRFSAEGEVKPLWDLAYGGDRELSGQVHMSGELGGTLNDPQFTGSAAVTGGRLQDYATGVVLTNLSANADLKRDVITIGSFTAKDEKNGTVAGSGSISLQRDGGSTLKLDLNDFRMIDNDTAEATASGQVTLTRGGDGKVKIEGTLDVSRAEINAEAKLHPSVATMDVIEKNLPERLEAQSRPAAARRGPPVTLDITLRAPRRVYVKGRGIDAELSLDAHVTGSLAKPALSGRARIVQGDYDFAGKRFEFDDSGVIYLANDTTQIRLDLSASWEGPSLTATIQIKGTAAKPEITLTSSPSLPQEEVLSQVLFGSSAAQLSGAETAQLASTVTALATGGGFDVLGSVRQFAGLDRLAFGASDAASGVTVAGGKYITDNVYLEIIGGGRTGPSAEVDWRIRRGVSIVSQIGGELGAKLSVRWTRDLGHGRRPDGAPPQ